VSRREKTTAPIEGQDVLDMVVSAYIESGDFNGLRVDATTFSQEQLEEARRLVGAGLLQVVSQQDYLNPHIRPWASRRTLEDQVADLGRVGDGGSACLYPTPEAMEGRPELLRWPDEPYRQRLAAGAGTLELAYFSVDVIEHYRNDPRYHYQFGDFEVRFGIGDEAYVDERERSADKIHSLRVGFAYDRTTIRANAVTRFTCAFIGDLADLTAEHQQRWRTYEVDRNENTGPHPVWWAMQMGHWPKGIGPFQRIVGEIRAINELFHLIAGRDLFKTSEPLREWGWVLRSSTSEWHQFLLATDKLISENIDHAVLTAVKVDRKNPDGTDAGSLNRLAWFLRDSTPCPEDLVAKIITPLKRVRKERQKPAHALVVAATDATLTAQQRDLLSEVGGALHLLREVLAMHPDASGWVVPTSLAETGYVL
jgi:hypothetical protein